MEFPFGHHHRRDNDDEEQPYPPPGHHHGPGHSHGHQPPPSFYGGEEEDRRPAYPPVQNVPHHGGSGYGEHQPHPPPSSGYYGGGTGSGDEYGRPNFPPVQHVAHEGGGGYGEPRPHSFGHHGGEHNYDRPPSYSSGGCPTGDHGGRVEEPSKLRQPTVRIFTRADENYSLSIRDGKVVLVRNDPSDQYQAWIPNRNLIFCPLFHWIKDMRYSTKVKDQEGFPSFCLINKATGEAVKHSIGATHPVRLVPYNPDYLDESVLWAESGDTGNGFRCIRMINNIGLNFDAFHGDKDHGGVRDGTTVVLWEWLKGHNQQWKIVPYCNLRLDVDATERHSSGSDYDM
ncbi:hypothetical protein ZIOFF_058893 [Zingiber officinale]|uniref:Ricin B-like lectin R40G3 n=1 Tax=Zingiber officinale TaxID=94328 RepID=A0A8J5F494_ZINOF|nr:hypothetical protein ZIOFF_058893 [Zingiber officinale]